MFEGDALRRSSLSAQNHLRMNPLDVGVQVPSLREGGGAEHAEVGLLAGVPRHVGLQHHLLVEGLAAVRALEGSLA